MDIDTAAQELSVDQLKVRQIADFYLQVLRSTEPLTQLLRYNPKAIKNLLNGKSPVDLKPFLFLIVQATYLLYICYLRKVNVLIGGEMLTKPQRRGELIHLQEVYVEFLFDRQYYRMAESELEVVSKKFKMIELTKSQSTFGQFICDFVIKIRNMIRAPLEKHKNSPEGYHRQMEALVYMIENHLMVRIKSISPSVVIMALEESELFREHSLILKCYNNSLFVSMRFFGGCKHLYHELLSLQDKQRLDTSFATRVEVLIEEAFKLLLTNQVIMNEKSLEENHQDSKNVHKPYTMGNISGNSLQSRRYSINIFIKEKAYRKFSQDRIEEIIKLIEKFKVEESDGNILLRSQGQTGAREKDKNMKNQCIIDFQASRNILCVKYVTPIELNVENTDVMMFHCNYMSRAWNSITLEFVERQTKAKKKERLLAFKTTSYISEKDKILLKIFTMLDLLVLYAKVMEPILAKNISNLEDYCLKNQQASEKCDHLRQLFIRKIEQCYLDISKMHTT